MSPEKFTGKLQEAFNASRSIATRHGHQELKPSHLILALLEQEGGIATPLFAQSIPITKLKDQIRGGWAGQYRPRLGAPAARAGPAGGVGRQARDRPLPARAARRADPSRHQG